MGSTTAGHIRGTRGSGSNSARDTRTFLSRTRGLSPRSGATRKETAVRPGINKVITRLARRRGDPSAQIDGNQNIDLTVEKVMDRHFKGWNREACKTSDDLRRVPAPAQTPKSRSRRPVTVYGGHTL